MIYFETRVKEQQVARIYDNNNYHESANLCCAVRTGENRLALLALQPQARIHEDGAGAGGFVAACRNAGHEAGGWDIGESATAQSKKLFDVDILNGSLDMLALPSEPADVMATFNLLSHLYRPWDYMKGVARVLAPNGRWILRTGDRSGRMKSVRQGN